MHSRWKLLAVWGVLLTLAVGLGGAICPAQEGPECTITVQPGESIQTAIDRAPEGAVVCLAEGEWEENISIEKSLTLRGQGAQWSVIRAKAEDIPVVRIRSDEEIQVQIEKLTVTGARYDDGILVEGSAQATISESAISENGDGIELRDWAQATITGSTVSGNVSGIRLRSSTQATISGNVIEGNSRCGIFSLSTGEVHGDGNEMRDNGVDVGGNLPGSLRLPLVEPSEQEIIYPDARYPTLQHAVDALLSGGRLILQGGEYEAGLTITKELTIAAQEGAEVALRERSEDAPVLSLVGGAKLSATGLKVTGGQFGFLLTADAQATITGSAISRNSVGIVLDDSAQVTISGSTVSSEYGIGISLSDSTQATISGSAISRNRYGIVLDDSTQATITGNVIEGNSRYGMFSSSTGEVHGDGNEMRDNGVDVGGNLPGSLRLPLVEPSEEEIIYPNARYPTLQHAVDALLPGGRLILQGGGYEAGLTITKELTIAAQEGAKVTLRARNWNAAVLSLVGGAKLSATGLKVTSSWEGFVLGAGAQATITGSTISENGFGISLTNSAQVTISGSTVSGNWNGGISLGDSAQATITGNAISGNSVGIYLMDSTQATITGSTISGNTYDGIWLNHSAQVTISGSTVSGNERDGIGLTGSAQATISGSTVSGNGEGGIYLMNSARATLEGNEILGNRRYGVSLYERPCFDTDELFTGYVTGRGNTIPGPGELGGNKKGAVCPDEFSFLMTEEGGELNRRLQGE